MSKRKAADSSGIVVEMLQAGGTALREAIAELFTDVLNGEEDPASWRETRLKVLYKKGDPKLPENYRPIAVISILYKVFARVVNQRLREKFDKAQSKDQAGFRSAFSCEDHLFVATILQERAAEYQSSLWMAAVDFRQAFPSVEYDAIWAALREVGVEECYTKALRRMYEGQQAQVVADKKAGDSRSQGGPSRVIPSFLFCLTRCWKF